MAWREQANFKDVVAETVDVSVTLQLPVYTVANKPTGSPGQLAFFSNGSGGDPALAVWTTKWVLAADGSTDIAAA